MQFEFDPNDHRCRHLRVNGARCTTPALRGETLCFEHKSRRLRTAPGRKPHLPDTFNEVPLVGFAWAEDHASVLYNLNSIMEAFAHGIIDHRQAVVFNCIQRTALKTLAQMRALEDTLAQEPPAQRFELDECGLPLAVDDPPPSDPSSPAPSNPEAPPEPSTLRPEPSAPSPVPCALTSALPSDPSAPSPVPCALTAGKPPAALPQPMPAPPPARPSWEDRIRDYYNNNPEFLLPMGIQPRPDPAPQPSAPDPAEPPAGLAPLSPLPSAPAKSPAPNDLPLSNLIPPLNEPGPHQTQAEWEDTLRDYYGNSPALLAPYGIHPRPEPEPGPEPNPDPPAQPFEPPSPVPCTLSPAPCPP